MSEHKILNEMSQEDPRVPKVEKKSSKIISETYIWKEINHEISIKNILKEMSWEDPRVPKVGKKPSKTISDKHIWTKVNEDFLKKIYTERNELRGPQGSKSRTNQLRQFQKHIWKDIN